MIDFNEMQRRYWTELEKRLRFYCLVLGLDPFNNLRDRGKFHVIHRQNFVPEIWVTL